MLSPNDFGLKVSASSIWSVDSGYETSRTISPSLQAQAPSEAFSNQAQHHTPVIFSQSDLWNAPVSNDNRMREDSLVDPITTQLNVCTTSDVPAHNFVLPEIPPFNQACLECEVWQLTNPGIQYKCRKCRTMQETMPATDGSSPTNKNALPRLQIPGNAPKPQLKRLRSPPRCSTCDVPVPEDSRYCSSCLSGSVQLSPLSPSSPEHRIKRSRAGRNSKLPITALARLQSWLDANKHNPYPSADTKRALAQECGITEKQVNTWFTNARARQMSAHQVESGSDIEGADDSDDAELSEANMGPSTILPGTNQSDQSYRRASAASQSRIRPSRRGKKKDYRRNQNADAPQTPIILSPAPNTSPIDQPQSADQEMWQCTFCFKALVPKSWRRHEDTQHRPKTQAARWTCMLHGPRLSFPNRTNSGSVCAFCMMKNPSEEHFIQHHRIDECSKRDPADRTFYRPDHLRQHIKNFHNATLFDIVQARWKKAAEIVAEGWTCGFCGDRLETWDKRETHISNHFKDGMTMASWRDHSDGEKKTDKRKTRVNENENEPSNTLDQIRIGNPFHRLDSSHHLSSQQARPQNNTFANTFQPLPMASQNPVLTHGYQVTPHSTSTGYPSAYTPPTAPIGLGISEAPVLPAIPNVSPFMVTQQELDAAGNFIDWTALPTSFDQQIQYSLPPPNAYAAAMAPATMQHDFNSGHSGFGMDPYGNSIAYQTPWAMLQQGSSPEPNQQRYSQHYQRRQ